jgi:hypothetical protein
MAAIHFKSFNLLLALVALHLTAILFYLAIRRENLIAPMIHGRKLVPSADATAVAPARAWRAVAGALLAAALVALIANAGR